MIFRHHQNASMNKDAEQASSSGRGNLKGFYSYKNTFDKDSVWLDIPKQVVFVDNSDPYNDDLEATLQESEAAILAANAQSQNWIGNSDIRDGEVQGLEALSTAADHDRFSFPSLSDQTHPSMSDSSPFTAISPPTSSGPSPGRTRSIPPHASPPVSISSNPTSNHNNNINFLLNPSHSLSPPIDPSIQQPARSSSISARSDASRPPAESITGVAAESDHEVAFLLRHYAEAPGLWMDLFDLGTYFASYVPIRALTNPLLKYAACAFSAKQLARVKGAKAPVGGVTSKQSAMESWPDMQKENWYWYGAKYYDKAIQLLMKELQPDKGPPPLSTPEAFGQWQAAELCEDNDENPRKRRRRHTNSRLSNGVHSDEVLTATAILSVYEFLDATPAWNRHLSGVKSLLDVAEVGMLPLEQHPLDPFQAPKKSGLSKARKAIFWNFARQDYLAAFINQGHTRLNTEDLVLWTEAGLQLDNMGFVRPTNTSAAGYPEGNDVMKEDLISNALIWILSKIVNFTSAGDNAHLDQNAIDTGPLGVSQHVLLERWYRLEAELDAWHNGLPDTFRPCARITPSTLPHYRPVDDADADAASLPEVWHCMPMCSATMQHYHMARILLLINKPHDSTSRRSTIANRLNSYRSIESEIRYHSREILGISLARPDSSVRIHSLQPLFVSGQCLTEARERRLIVRLLRDVERDLGWATGYRVKHPGYQA